MLSDLLISWNGMLNLAVNFKINTLEVDGCHPLTKQFNDLLYMFDVKQHIDKPTRISQRSSSCLVLIISNLPKCVNIQMFYRAQLVIVIIMVLTLASISGQPALCLDTYTNTSVLRKNISKLNIY